MAQRIGLILLSVVILVVVIVAGAVGWAAWLPDTLKPPLERLLTAQLGQQVRIDGPLRVERPVQGHPIIAQAGSSDSGLDFGTAVSDTLFCVNLTIDAATRFYKDVKARVVAQGLERFQVEAGVARAAVQEDHRRSGASARDLVPDPTVGDGKVRLARGE